MDCLDNESPRDGAFFYTHNRQSKAPNPAFFSFRLTTTKIFFLWRRPGYPQYSAAAVQALQLRKANFLRRLCGVLASIPGALALPASSIAGLPLMEEASIVTLNY
jgi:hypothetical protein